MPIIFDAPFDESPQSPIAADFSQYHHPAIIHGTPSFVPGHDGYAIHFDGNTYAKADNVPLDLTGPFTILFWLKTEQQPGFSLPTKLRFQFAFSDDSIKQMILDCVADTWELFAIVRDDDKIYLYKNNALEAYITLTAGSPVEWAVKQTGDETEGFPYTFPLTFGDYTEAPYAQGEMDHLLIFNEALTPDEIIAATTPPRHTNFWEVDGRNFLEWDVYVDASNGLLDALKLKEPTTIDWAGEHGVIMDTMRPRFQPREIELSCWMKAGGMLEFTAKMNDFLQQFTEPKYANVYETKDQWLQSHYHRLTCRIDKYRPICWEVYLPDTTDMDKKWHDDLMFGRFTLKLTDNNPIRKILRFEYPESQSAADATCHIYLHGTGVYNVFWGDGHSDIDIATDTEQVLYHRYEKPGIYEIIVAGEVRPIPEYPIQGMQQNVHDGLYTFGSNAITIWNRL